MSLEVIEMDSDQKKEQALQIKENIERVSSTQNDLEQIKTNLNQMIDTMMDISSYVSIASAFWEKRPLWQKILAGGILIAPFFIAAVITHIGVLIAICVALIIVYTAVSLLLDNHAGQSFNGKEQLKACINGIVTSLNVVISSLNKLCGELGIQVGLFQQENEKLTINVQELGVEIDELKVQRQLLQETEQALRKTNKELETITASLKESVKEHTDLLMKNEAQLNCIQEKYALAQSKLTETVSELNQVKLEMSERVENLGNLTLALEGVINTFRTQLKLDKDQQEAFTEKLKLFITNKEQSFLEIAERMCEADYKLQIQQDLYNKLNDDHQKLLNRNESQIHRLEQIHIPQLTGAGDALRKLGLYAIKESGVNEEVYKYDKAALSNSLIPILLS